MKNLVLAGILSTLTALGAIGLMKSAPAADASLPVGTIIAWGGPASSVPTNWMLCNGKALSKTVYKDLFAAIGSSWGSAGAKFNLPDLRGRFLRGDDAGTGRDPDVKKRMPSMPGGSATGVGSVQEDSMQNHSHDQGPHYHTYTVPGNVAHITDLGSGTGVYKSQLFDAGSSLAINPKIWGVTTYGTKSRANAGEESRPKNAAVNFIIKVK
jgi:microcystin-dependent protein